jgi:exonuclease SbcC
MIFKFLHMENIRSFVNGQINFPLGISLFEGDVGSGKSTILMAIEFALFGLGNQKGDSLLRKKTKNGSVNFKFEVNGKKCEISRTLTRKEKGGSVRQGKCLLIVNGSQFHLSPTEIKEKVLDILNFNEPLNPRAQSIIFRYAIYTPQEEMRDILSQKVDSRLQTLRKAFGIEDYKIAGENATILSHSIKNKIIYLEGQTADLITKKKILTDLLQKKEYNNINLIEFIGIGEKYQKELEIKKEELEELERVESYLEKINAQIPYLQDQIRDKNQLISKYMKDIEDLKKDNVELFNQIEILIKVENPTSDNIEVLEKKISYFKKLVNSRNELSVKLSLTRDNRKDIENKIIDHKNDKLKDIEIVKNELISQIENLKNLINLKEISLKKISEIKNKLKGKRHTFKEKIENLNGLGDLCPICGSKLNEDHKRNLKIESRTVIQDIDKDIINEEELETNSLEELKSLKIKLENLNDDLQNLKFIAEKVIELNELDKKIANLNNELRNLDSNILLIIENLDEFENLEDYIKYFENLLNRVLLYNQGLEEIKNLKYRYEKNGVKIKQIIENNGKIQSEIVILNNKLSHSKEELGKLENILNKLQEMRFDYKILDDKFQSIKEKIVSLKTIIKGIDSNIKDIQDEIIEKEKLKAQYHKLYDYNSWFNDYLIPTLNLIEKHVLKQYHKSFNLDFQKWLGLLLDDITKSGKINEEFTPIVEQDGFEQELNFLSGGEKTSVALAYRLALNHIVQKVSSGMKSNLLILDEPTDGFSKEQLYKVRDILNELDCPQIILVSHERELESFADNIFIIEKVNGVSKIISNYM